MLKNFLTPKFWINFCYILFFLFFFWVICSGWLSGGFIIAGHDSGLPLNTDKFLKTRFFAWDERVGFGQDNSALFGSIILHSFDHLFAYLSGVTAAGNVLALTFWLGLIFISAFIFAHSFRKVFNEYFVYIFPPLMTVNFYIFQSVFILERAKYEIIVSLLIFIALVFKLFRGEIKLLTAAILSSLVFFIFNGGGWIGLPLYGGVIIFILTFVCLKITESFLNFTPKPILRFLSLLFLTACFSLLLNSYSILPYFVTFRGADSAILGDVGLKKANIEWIGSLSHGASFLNLFRLQGVPDWFSGPYVLSPGHPFAQSYFEQVPLLIFSFLIPILALLSLVLIRKKQQTIEVIIFWILTLVGMFFAAGTHPPLGFIYEFIYNYIPGFIIFRSPYYKFGSLLFIGLSVLVAFSISELSIRINSKFRIYYIKRAMTFFLLFGFIGCWLLFHYKLYNSDIFSWQKGFTSRIKTPNYINEFSTYADDFLSDKRILILPPFDDNWRNDGYLWGYWSLSTLPYSLSSKNFIVNGFGLTKEEEKWVNKLYSELENKNEAAFLEISKRLNIGYILFRSDYARFPESQSRSEDFYKQVIDNFSNIKKMKDFDKWSLYNIENSSNNQFTVINSLTLVSDNDSYLSRDFLDNQRSIFFNDLSSSNSVLKNDSFNLERFARIKAFSVDCSSCFLEQYQVSNKLPDVTVLPDALLYKYKVYKENQEIENMQNDDSRVSTYLAFILRRTAEHFAMINAGSENRYIKSNIDIVNNYLDRIYDLLKKTSSSDTDYKTIIRILSGIEPVENNLRNFILDKEFLIRPETVQNSFLDTMMKIYIIKDYYRSILSDPNKLRYEKKYSVNSFPENTFFYLRNSTLPVDDKNKTIIPSEISIQQDEKVTKLATGEKTNSDWIEIKLPNLENKKGIINLKYNTFPNLYSPLGLTIQFTPTGEKSCYSGKIQNFNPLKIYETLLTVTNKQQVLKLFFKDESDNEQFNFLIGRPQVNIFPILSYQPFRYIYRPLSNVKNPTVFICSDNKELPQFDKLEIFEVSSPQLIIVEKGNDIAFQKPEIEVTKLNSAKYIVNIKNAQDPFILSLNQRYSSLWKLFYDNNEIAKFRAVLDGKKDPNQMVVDGYANGWVIEKKGNYSVIVEYEPQIFFSLGTKITVISLFLSILYLGFIFLKKYLQNKNV